MPVKKEEELEDLEQGNNDEKTNQDVPLRYTNNETPTEPSTDQVSLLNNTNSLSIGINDNVRADVTEETIVNYNENTFSETGPRTGPIWALCCGIIFAGIVGGVGFYMIIKLWAKKQ